MGYEREREVRMPERMGYEREREYEEWSSDLRSSKASIINSIGSSFIRTKEEKYEPSIYDTWRHRNLMWRGIQSSSIRSSFKPSTGLDSTRFKKPQP